MRLSFLFVLALVTGSVFGSSEGSSDKGSVRTPCEFGFATDVELANASKLFQVYVLDDDTDSAAYIGISHEMLLELFRLGRIQFTETSLEYSGVHLTSDHPTSRLLIEKRSKWFQDDWGRREARGTAARGASRQSAVDVIMGRARLAAIRPIPFKDVTHFAYEILLSLSYRNWIPGDKPLFSVSFPDLRHTMIQAEIPYAEPTILDEDLPRGLKTALNMGSDYEELMIDQKIIHFAKSMGLPTNEILVANSKNQKTLLALFKDLPSKAGYVIGVRDSLIVDKNPDKPAIKSLQLDDIVEIEGITQTEDSFLESLRQISNPP